MAEDHRPVVERALKLKKVGNELVEIIAGRSVHPVGVCVGGFYRAPEADQWSELLPELKAGLEDMCELTLFLAEKLDYPDLDQDYEFVALNPDDEYPMNLGPIASNKGFRVEQGEYLDVIEEKHVEHSTALHAAVKGRGPYHVGPLARLNLNAERLHPRAAELLPRVCDAVGRSLPWQNSFLSLPARALETVHALALAIDELEDYQRPSRSRVPIEPCAGRGAAATEAPRGILWHEYETDDDGLITAARIIPPTSQNQPQIEADLRALADKLSSLDDEALCLRCEHLIRNYDPCISCSVHFLKLHVERLP
jgi:coenzyme F420-reducing hydrogenase alpha subunit